MPWLGVPVVENPHLTRELLFSIRDTARAPWNIGVVIFDNGSDLKYEPSDWQKDFPFRVKVIRDERNRGFYRPILDLADFATQADIVALCHNDLYFYEKDWDVRLQEVFAAQANNGLGMIGFCGSDQIDDRGGGGGGGRCECKNIWRGHAKRTRGR